MVKHSKKFYIVGNWKMLINSIAEAKTLFGALSRASLKQKKAVVIAAVPAPFLALLGSGSKKAVYLGAQDVFQEASGSYTGGISANAVESSGAKYVIVGHSERRVQGEIDAVIARKAVLVIESGMTPIVCVGERARDVDGKYLAEIKNQLLGSIAGIPKEKIDSIIVAYEPVWAIGKAFGGAMEPTLIHEMVIYIKKVLSEIVGKETAFNIPVLYGGSVDDAAAQAIIGAGDADGLLIGRMSVNKEAITKIISYVK
jgi:triosephosphate isomerase